MTAERCDSRLVGRTTGGLLATLFAAMLISSCSGPAEPKDDLATRRVRAEQDLRENPVWHAEDPLDESPRIQASARAHEENADTSTQELSRDEDGAPAPAMAATDEQALARTAATETGTAEPAPGDASAGPDPAAVAALAGLGEQALEQWREFSDGFREQSAETTEEQRRQEARGLVRLSIVEDPARIDVVQIEDAYQVLRDSGDDDDLMLMASSLRHLGRTAEADDIARELDAVTPTENHEPIDDGTSRDYRSEEESSATWEDAWSRAVATAPAAAASGSATSAEVTPVTEIDLASSALPAVATSGAAAAADIYFAEDDPSSEYGPPDELESFTLGRVSFAQRIDGPGDFVALDKAEIHPGRQVLVYGEFLNFASKAELDDPADTTTWIRSFAAQLRLETSGGQVLETLDFLPAETGRQEVVETEEPVNFWARYRIPSNLSQGNYRIVVDGRDLIGNSAASQVLDFEIR